MPCTLLLVFSSRNYIVLGLTFISLILLLSFILPGALLITSPSLLLTFWILFLLIIFPLTPLQLSTCFSLLLPLCPPCFYPSYSTFIVPLTSQPVSNLSHACLISELSLLPRYQFLLLSFRLLTGTLTMEP